MRLYEHALEQYRFEVQLNWDRTKYYLVFNVGILGVASGLFSLLDRPVLRLVVLLLFAVGALAALHSMQMIRIGREYTRVAMVKALLVAKELGLTNVRPGHSDPLATHAIGTTSGMRDPEAALASPSEWIRKPVGKGNVVYSVLVFLWALLIVDVAAAAVVLFTVLGCPGWGGACA